MATLQKRADEITATFSREEINLLRNCIVHMLGETSDGKGLNLAMYEAMTQWLGETPDFDGYPLNMIQRGDKK